MLCNVISIGFVTHASIGFAFNKLKVCINEMGEDQNKQRVVRCGTKRKQISLQSQRLQRLFLLIKKHQAMSPKHFPFPRSSRRQNLTRNQRLAGKRDDHPKGSGKGKDSTQQNPQDKAKPKAAENPSLRRSQRRPLLPMPLQRLPFLLHQEVLRTPLCMFPARS